MVRTRSLTAAAAPARLRSGLAAAITRWPSATSGSITRSQLADSAKAPWTRTMVGLTEVLWGRGGTSVTVALVALRSPPYEARVRPEARDPRRRGTARTSHRTKATPAPVHRRFAPAASWVGIRSARERAHRPGPRRCVDWALPPTRSAPGRATVEPDPTRSAEAEMLTPKVTPITIGTAHPSSQRRSREMTNDLPSPAHARQVLDELRAERATALGAGLAHNVIYMDELEADLEAAREAYVGLAVSEIATLRGELFGRQVG